MKNLLISFIFFILIFFGCNNTESDEQINSIENIDQEILDSLHNSDISIAGSSLEWFVGLGTDFEEHVHEGMQTSDGGYIGVGSGNNGNQAYDILIIKTDNLGVLEWMKNFGIAGEKGSGYTIDEVSDGFIVGGGIYDPDVDRNQLFLAKINKSGGVIWEKFFPTDGIGAIRGIDISSDDNIIITGFRNAPNTDEFQGFVFIAEDSEGFVMKLDSNGNVIWDKTLNFSQGTKVREIIDGYAVISCTWQNSGDGDNMEFSLAKLNENGEIIWEKHLGGLNHDHLYDFDVTSDGGFILGGHTLSYGVVNWDYLLMRVDSNGDEVWHKTFGQPRGYDPNYIHDEAYGVRQTSDGGFIIVGGSGDEHSYSSSDHPTGPSDEWKVYIVKTDENGEKIWDDVYPKQSIGNNAGEYLGLTDDGGVIIFVDSDSHESPAPNNFGFMKLSISE